MAIEKLSEFAKDGQKNTDDLVLTDGFSVSRKPARQWFNWLFNTLTLKINEIIEADYIRRNEIVDNLTTDDATKPVSAKQAKFLNDNKLDKTENAVSATKLKATRIISFSGGATGSFNFDGSGNSSCILTLANSGVVANTYGSNLKIPTITVNAKGLIAGVSEQQIPIVDDLTTGGSEKLLSAEQGKLLQANKLDKSALNNTLTSTSTTQAVTAAQAKVLNDQAFGVGQTRKDVSASRLPGTTYFNATQKAFFISITIDNAATAAIQRITIEAGGIKYMNDRGFDNDTLNAFAFTFPVLPGESWYYNHTGIGNRIIVEVS